MALKVYLHCTGVEGFTGPLSAPLWGPAPLPQRGPRTSLARPAPSPRPVPFPRPAPGVRASPPPARAGSGGRGRPPADLREASGWVSQCTETFQGTFRGPDVGRMLTLPRFV